MLYEVEPDSEFPLEWRCEAIDKKTGDIYVAVFAGSDAESRARRFGMILNGVEALLDDRAELLANPQIGTCDICGLKIWRKDGMIEEFGKQWNTHCRERLVARKAGMEEAAKIADKWANSHSCSLHYYDLCCHVRTGAGIATAIRKLIAEEEGK